MLARLVPIQFFVKSRQTNCTLPRRESTLKTRYHMAKMYTRQDAAKDAASTNISREHAEKMIQMAQGKYVTPTKNHGMRQISRLSPQQIASRQTDSLVSTAQVSTADRLPANTTSAQPLWGEWPQDFWDRSGAAQEQAEDEAWCARLHAPQQLSQLIGGTAEVYDWGDYPAGLMPG